MLLLMPCDGDDDMWCDGNNDDMVHDGDRSDSDCMVLMVCEGGDVWDGMG